MLLKQTRCSSSSSSSRNTTYQQDVALRRCRANGTEAILELLQEFGIRVDKDYFFSEIEDFSSAEELIRLWIENYHLDIRNGLINFTFLAIIVLAKRLAPAHLLLEYLDDWMNQ